jgi:hypothetical protein
MYLDELKSIRVTELRRSGALTPDTTGIAITLPGDDGVPVSTEVAVVCIGMRSGGIFFQFVCGRCGRRAQVLQVAPCADPAAGAGGCHDYLWYNDTAAGE